jgi:hypothetical protein
MSTNLFAPTKTTQQAVTQADIDKLTAQAEANNKQLKAINDDMEARNAATEKAINAAQPIATSTYKPVVTMSGQQQPKAATAVTTPTTTTPTAVPTTQPTEIYKGPEYTRSDYYSQGMKPYVEAANELYTQAATMQPESKDMSDYIAALAKDREDEEKERKRINQIKAISGIGDAIRHMSNLIYTTKGAPSQKIADATMPIEGQYQRDRAQREAQRAVNAKLQLEVDKEKARAAYRNQQALMQSAAGILNSGRAEMAAQTADEKRANDDWNRRFGIDKENWNRGYKDKQFNHKVATDNANIGLGRARLAEQIRHNTTSEALRAQRNKIAQQGVSDSSKGVTLATKYGGTWSRKTLSNNQLKNMVLSLQYEKTSKGQPILTKEKAKQLTSNGGGGNNLFDGYVRTGEPRADYLACLNWAMEHYPTIMSRVLTRNGFTKTGGRDYRVNAGLK